MPSTPGLEADQNVESPQSHPAGNAGSSGEPRIGAVSLGMRKSGHHASPTYRRERSKSTVVVSGRVITYSGDRSTICPRQSKQLFGQQEARSVFEARRGSSAVVNARQWAAETAFASRKRVMEAAEQEQPE